MLTVAYLSLELEFNEGTERVVYRLHGLLDFFIIIFSFVAQFLVETLHRAFRRQSIS